MLIVDAQIHLWEKGTPSAHHRQEPYSAEQAIAGMDAAGVDRALIHPVMWDPHSNELAVEAVRRYPGRFGIMGWFYLDQPENRVLAEHWKERPGMLGLRFYFNERHKETWVTGYGPPPSAPASRCRLPPRCFCRLSARSPSATLASN